MFKSIKLLLVCFTVGVLVTATTVYAGEMNLSSQQRDQLKNLGENLKKETSDLRMKLRTSREDLADIYSTYKLDEKKARAQIAKINDTQYKLLVAGLDDQVKIRKILSEDQFAEFVKMQKDHSRRHHRSHGTHRSMIGHDKMQDISRALEKSDITPAQKQKLRQMDNDGGENSYKNMRTAVAEVERIYSSYQLNQNSAKAALKRVNQAQKALMLANLDKQKQLRKVLTAEQFSAARKQIAANWKK
jgi:Spy/CpxP family protein refolding chaperone